MDNFKILIIIAIVIMASCIFISLVAIFLYLKTKNYNATKNSTKEKQWIDMHRIASEYVEVKEMQVKRLDTFYPVSFNDISYYLNNCES